jgi:preprotein translocase subunit YajC
MINLYDINEGDQVILKNGSIGTCTENMSDGQWIEIEANGDTILVHSQEIQDVIKAE